MKRFHSAYGIYHIVNRGSKKEAIFLDYADYNRFLNKLSIFIKETKNSLIQYCLLPNHFHLLVKAFDDNSITKLMSKLTISHVRYFCKKYSYVGRVFQGPYKSVAIASNTQLRVASRYIHRNPIEYFGDESLLDKYPWSSYREYLFPHKNNITKKASREIVLSLFNSIKEYKEFVEADELAIQARYKFEAIKLAHNSRESDIRSRF